MPLQRTPPQPLYAPRCPFAPPVALQSTLLRQPAGLSNVVVRSVEGQRWGR